VHVGEQSLRTFVAEVVGIAKIKQRQMQRAPSRSSVVDALTQDGRVLPTTVLAGYEGECRV